MYHHINRKGDWLDSEVSHTCSYYVSYECIAHFLHRDTAVSSSVLSGLLNGMKDIMKCNIIEEYISAHHFLPTYFYSCWIEYLHSGEEKGLKRQKRKEKAYITLAIRSRCLAATPQMLRAYVFIASATGYFQSRT